MRVSGGTNVCQDTAANNATRVTQAASDVFQQGQEDQTAMMEQLMSMFGGMATPPGSEDRDDGDQNADEDDDGSSSDENEEKQYSEPIPEPSSSDAEDDSASAENKADDDGDDDGDDEDEDEDEDADEANDSDYVDPRYEEEQRAERAQLWAIEQLCSVSKNVHLHQAMQGNGCLTAVAQA